MAQKSPLLAGAEIEDIYDLVENDRGELMLALNARIHDPDAPVLMMARDQDIGILQRNPDLKIGLTEMHPEAAKKLRAAREVLVVEASEDKIHHSYPVQVSLVSGA